MDRAVEPAHTVDDLRRTVVTVRGDVPVFLETSPTFVRRPPCAEGSRTG